MVAGLASTIFIPLTTWLVGQYGWRDALEVLALFLPFGLNNTNRLAIHKKDIIGRANISLVFTNGNALVCSKVDMLF